MKRLFFLWLLLTVFINAGLFSQSRAEIKNNFYDAESWILFEAYRDALPLYQQLLNIYPKNSNFRYRIGQCLINTPGEKEKAVNYLEEAVKNIDPLYHAGKFRETGAPYDALYYLANAYRINNQLDKAIETYRQFKKNPDIKEYDSTLVNFQIRSCLNAKELMKSPEFIREQNLGDIINGRNQEFNPVISDNEDLLVFSRSEAFYDAILFSTKVNGVWAEPQNMNELLKVDRDIYPVSFSGDGKTLYLYNSADYDGDICSSDFDNGKWSPVVKLNNNINTKYWESHATVTHDNRKLYFTSNRKGSLGGLDIYVAKRDSSGDWGIPENLGPVINTPYNEESPFLSKDDRTLFFSSRGHYNMGGYDIFFSTLLDNGQWSVPQNIGYPLNTTDDDVFFRTLDDGYKGYYAMDNPDGFGKQDIYRIEIFTDKHPRNFFVSGLVKVADHLRDYKDSVKVTVTSINNPAQIQTVYSLPKNGEYWFKLPQGDFQITYEAYGAEKVKTNMNLSLLNPIDSITIPPKILPRTDFTADLRVEGNRNISVTQGDSIIIPLRAEPASWLTIENWFNDSMTSVKQYVVADSAFNYKMSPKPGENRVVFKLTDRFSNDSSTEVIVTRKQRTSTRIILPGCSETTAQKKLPESKPADSITAKADPGLSKPSDTIKSQLPTQNHNCFWILWITFGLILLIFFIIFSRRRKKNENKEEI